MPSAFTRLPSLSGSGANGRQSPPDRRRRGYASIATAELSQRLLNTGKQFCWLYTDLDYPTSNAIYHAIGYVPVQDALDIAFP